MDNTLFSALCDCIIIISTIPASETDYHNVVSCIRKYINTKKITSIELTQDEKREILRRGWTKEYNPFYMPENIRYGMVFDNQSNNIELHECIQKYNELLENYIMNGYNTD